MSRRVWISSTQLLVKQVFDQLAALYCSLPLPYFNGVFLDSTNVSLRWNTCKVKGDDITTASPSFSSFWFPTEVDWWSFWWPLQQITHTFQQGEILVVNESLALCLMKDFPCHQPPFPPHLHMNLWQQRKLLGVSVNVNDFPFALWLLSMTSFTLLRLIMQ